MIQKIRGKKTMREKQVQNAKGNQFQTNANKHLRCNNEATEQWQRQHK